MPKETPFTKRELELMFKRLEEILESHGEVHSAIMDAIKGVSTKQDYTNGKVGELVKWREWVTGAMAVISVVVIPLMGYVLWQVSHLDTTIDTALADYEFQVTE